MFNKNKDIRDDALDKLDAKISELKSSFLKVEAITLGKTFKIGDSKINDLNCQVNDLERYIDEFIETYNDTRNENISEAFEVVNLISKENEKLENDVKIFKQELEKIISL
jgi:predicted RecB family endonuclease